jgi:hypothetical protein
MVLFFRTLEDAQACLAALPEFELADRVGGYVLFGWAVMRHGVA